VIWPASSPPHGRETRWPPPPWRRSSAISRPGPPLCYWRSTPRSGGGRRLSRAGDLIVGRLRERLAELCLHSPEITVSTLGDEAVATGAIRLALERATAELFPDGAPL